MDFTALIQVNSPYLDIGLSKLKKKIDWVKFSDFLTKQKTALKYFYYFDHFKEDYRSSSYLLKIENLGFELIARKLPPTSKPIIKEMLAVELATDMVLFAFSTKESKKEITVVCPIRDLRYPMLKVKKTGVKLRLVDFEGKISKELISLADELITLDDRVDIYL